VDTIVILMGLQNLWESMKQLLEGGCEPGRPVALIQSGTRPSQRTLIATVATIANLAEGAEFKSPTLIVVGEVVNFRRRLHGAKVSSATIPWLPGVKLWKRLRGPILSNFWSKIYRTVLIKWAMDLAV
jgi:hypothetical protein